VSQRRGLAATELAVLLPFLAFAFVVALDYCRVFFCTQTVQGCADAGARYAAGVAKGTDSSATNAQSAAVAAGVSLSPPLTEDNVTVSVQNGTATVTVTWTFTTLIPYPGLPSQVVLTRSTAVPVAPQPFGS
jgi:hypothetical protein